jgi:hypothetical protein
MLLWRFGAVDAPSMSDSREQQRVAVEPVRI